jgi:hypothetical protein
LEAADDHLFWIDAQQQWVAGNLLQIGDQFVLSNGGHAELVDIRKRVESTVVYNFDVDSYESYFANGIFVHQKCEAYGSIAVDERLRELFGNQEKSAHDEIYSEKPGYFEKQGEVSP